MAVIKIILSSIVCLLGLGPLTSIAEVPHVFESGKPALAKEINENFKAIDNAPPKITAAALSFSDEYAIYYGDISITDENDIFRVQFQLGSVYPGVETLQTLLGDNGLIETGYANKVTEFWPAPGTKSITLSNALLYRFTEGPLMVIAQDVAGNLGRLAVTIPKFRGGMIKEGTYQLDTTFSGLPISEATDVCWSKVGRLTSPWTPPESWSTTSFSYSLAETPTPVKVSNGNIGTDGNAKTACDQFNTTTNSTVYDCSASGVSTSYWVNSESAYYRYERRFQYTYLSDNTINAKRSFHCGKCNDDDGDNNWDCNFSALSGVVSLSQESTATWVSNP